jgi:cellulose synthase/poly-beta-1,6-N-acetylglucosamine synthase-like glycosyltransferase
MFEGLLGLAYLICFSVLFLYGLHRARLVYLIWKNRSRLDRAQGLLPAVGSDLPVVTVQLPMFNEATVAGRLIEAAGRLDYPLDRLEIQVLDDSTDETRTIAEAKVAELQARGIDATYVRRPTREGYKAGALDYGLRTARGELVAIFDADFIPQPGFLRRIVGHFDDPRVAVVQTRWEHMNRDLNLLTQVQSLMLDGHHLVENRARFGGGLLWNFSGTGGMWRKVAIEDAGGWQHDTITEDLDLSYRAQMRGWRFVYRGDVLTPSELPEDVSSFRAQQFRWAKGTVQTSRKLLKHVMQSHLTPSQKFEAFFHLTPHYAYPFIVLLTLLLLPTVAVLPASDFRNMVAIDLPITLISVSSLAFFYALANVAGGRSAWEALLRLPAIVAINAGLAPNQTRAVFAGLREMAGEFVRTPKKGQSAGRYFQAADLPWAEFGLGIVSAVTMLVAVERGHYFAAPFAGLFSLGYFYVSAVLVSEQFARRRAERTSLPPAADTVGADAMGAA